MLPLIPLRRFCVAITITAIACTSLEARIGDSQSTLEGRMLRDRAGISVPSSIMKQSLDHKSVPYKNLIEYFPERCENEYYYKVADGKQASASAFDDTLFPDGWTIHVVYYKGQSVFEAYRRNGEGMTRFEEEGLLEAQKGGSHWQRVQQANNTALGYSFERADGDVRAIRKGPYLIFYRPEFDEGIKTQLDEEKSEKDTEDMEKVKESLKGF